MKKFLIDCNSTTTKAIKKINQLGGKSLVVTENNKKLKGILSSFDLRKAIMNKNILNKNINTIYNKKPKYIYSDEISKKNSELFIKIKQLEILPVIDRKTRNIIDILTFEKYKKLLTKKLGKINCSVVIMAGGKGTRLKPYTEILPKPLLPINNKPAIRHILEKFNKHKPSKFFITLNYKAEILKSYFKEIKELFNIKILEEDKPLGTAGSLVYLKNKIKDNFFLTNCDTIINTDYSKILEYHKLNKLDITTVVANKKFVIPYGVCDIKDKKFNIVEKPHYRFNVNVGLYLINKNILNLINKNKSLDFNQLLLKAHKNSKRIGLYEIREKDWIDVGQMDKYKNYKNKEI